jgi:nitrate reductase (NAD(P)H)
MAATMRAASPDPSMSKHEEHSGDTLPLTPPLTDDNSSSASADLDDIDMTLPPPSRKPEKVLDVDLQTPDAHVPRDPRLIRLT